MADAKYAGIAVGIVWAMGLLVLGISAWLTEYGIAMVTLLGTIYRGYAPTLLGSMIGMIWAFVDGFIAGYLVVWIYNRLVD